MKNLAGKRTKNNVIQLTINNAVMTEPEMALFLEDLLSLAEFDQEAIGTVVWFLSSLLEIAKSDRVELLERLETLQREAFRRSPEFSECFESYLKTAAARFRLPQR